MKAKTKKKKVIENATMWLDTTYWVRCPRCDLAFELKDPNVAITTCINQICNQVFTINRGYL